MANFTAAAKAINSGKHVRRNGWGKGSAMYADANGQLMRTRNAGASYGWILDLNDLTAKDWQVVEPTLSAPESR
jgi:hypothetical protein